MTFGVTLVVVGLGAAAALIYSRAAWYWCALLNGAAGYLPEVYVAAAYRGGQGLPTC